MRNRLLLSSGRRCLPERRIAGGENATIEVTGSIAGGENGDPFVLVLRCPQQEEEVTFFRRETPVR